MCDFSVSFRVSVPALGRCEVISVEEIIEEVKAFKYLRTVLCKHEICGRNTIGL